MQIAIICLSVILLLSWVACGLLLWKRGLYKKILAKIGVHVTGVSTNWTLFSWSSMIEKLDYRPDIVFFGDSITRGSDFRFFFPSKKIVNLGCSGDTVDGLRERIPMVCALAPQKVFVLVGINGLKKKSRKEQARKYEEMLTQLKAAVPSATLYVQGLLPISRSKEKSICPNATIRLFNDTLRALAKKHECTFIELYDLYEKEGELNPTLTVDGIHLRENAYDRWAGAIRPFIDSM